MSRPQPISNYPPRSHQPHQPMPPFPQLLHIKDERSGTQSRKSSVDNHEYGSEEEEEDELHHSPPHSGGQSKADDKSKERKPHATRRRVVQSCSECRRRKIKCDKKFPCGPCILRSDQARCHEVGMAEKTVVSNSSNYATTSDLAALAHRLDALESSLIKSGALLSSDLDHFLKASKQKLAELSPTHTYPQPEQRTKVPALAPNDQLDDTEGAALTLEHLAFGRSRVDGSHSLPHFGARYPSTVARSVPNNGYHLARTAGTAGTSSQSPRGVDVTLRHHSIGHGNSPLSGLERSKAMDQLLDVIGPTDIFDMFYCQTEVVNKAITRVIPSKETGELLVNAYINKVDWLHRCIHVPTFLRSCQDLWALPKDQVVYEISMPFLALYLVVCTLGMQFMDNNEVTKHFSAEEVQQLPDLWYKSARAALWSGDFLADHTMEALQCLILMMVFMNNRDRADAAWALLGAAVKMAQGLGLSRLGAEQQMVDGKPLPMWTGRWESLTQREVGRRIWWNLVFLDWALAPSYHFSCSIQADQIKTALPANIDDEDLVDGEPLKPKPISVRTSMSFQLARLKFAEIAHRQIWQANNNNHPPYSFILSVDGELRKAMIDLPAFFQPDPNTRGPPTTDDPKAMVHYWEKIMLNLAIHSRMLRLHRPWLSKGYEDERFAYSKEQCIRAARASLRMMSDSNGTAAFIEKWWIPLFYVSVSGLVVIIDLLRTARRQMQSTESTQKIQEVKGALDQMRRIADISHPSRAAVKVMDFLMAEIEERRKPSSSLGKRKAGDESTSDETSDLQRAVKKLIQKAQLEADSPNQSLGSNGTPPGWSPRTGREMDMRIFSDTPRDRPVFDAYPLPGVEVNGFNANDGQAAGNGAGGGGGLQPPQFNTGATSPFTFPVDPTNATFPPFNPRIFGATQTPQLDPAVENILTSYFPQPQTSSNTAGSATVPQVPDDFLSKVFNFGWDSNVGTTANQPAGNESGNGAVNSANGQVMGGDGLNNISDGLGFDGWGAHGWMA